MTTWTQINQKLDLFMEDEPKKDADGGLRPRMFPESLRIEGWNWAQRVLCAHTPVQRTVKLVIDKDHRTGILPEDFFAVEGIYDRQEQQWWWPMRRRPGDVRYEDDSLCEFWVWGGKLFLEDDVPYDSDRLTLHYWAYYPDIAYDVGAENLGTDQQPVYGIELKQKQVHTPRWAEVALLNLVCAFCFTPASIQAADVNEWKISVDSGNPLQNPRAQQAREHLFWYHAILEKFVPARGAE